MIILFGGFLGSGRRPLARNIAELLSAYYFDLDSKKVHYFDRDAHGVVHERTMRPHSDALRMHLYERIAVEFPLISKMHNIVVIDDAFHRTAPRDYFFREARRHFGDVFFIWVECAEEHVSERLARMHARNMIQSVEDGWKRRKKAQLSFQPFASPPFIFTCDRVISDAEHAAVLVRLIVDEMAHPTGKFSI